MDKDRKPVGCPCKVGDTLYTNISSESWHLSRKERPYEVTVVSVGLDKNGGFMNVRYGNGRIMDFNLSDIGNAIFLKKEEAFTYLILSL